MKHLISFFILFCGYLPVSAQYSMTDTEQRNSSSLSVNTIFFPLGNSIIPIRTTQYGNNNEFVYISLHDDESTSVEATRNLLEEEGGLLIELMNKGRRDLRFRIGNTFYTVDPNRIFSPEGISISLKEKGSYSNKASLEVAKLGQRIVALFPKNPACIIALHNNTPGNFSVNEYLPGMKRGSDAAKVIAFPEQDPDDLFITTDPGVFKHLTREKYNTVLQDNENCRQDGSLSVYCGNNNIRYVNLETEHGKYGQYSEIIGYLYEVLTTKNLSSDEYNFTAVVSPAIKLPGADALIYFGNKKIGTINSILQTEQTGNISGTLLINKDFPLFSNMRLAILHILFIIGNESRGSRIVL